MSFERRRQRKEKNCRRGIECMTTGAAFGKWFRKLRSRRRGSLDVSVSERGDGYLGNGTRSKANGSLVTQAADGISPLGFDSVRNERETAFNVGVGCGLVYLIAETRNEITKLAELRTQMDSLIQDAKKELQRKETFSLQPETNEKDASSSKKIKEQEQNGCRVGMDHLEAELEAELELLQVNLDRRKSPPEHQQQQLSVTIEHTAPEGSLSVSFEEVIYPQEEETQEHCGVSPTELERRLHELLETRQQEQIQELEAALERAKRKLHEKELEVKWWKDTAHLISQHVPESCHYMR
ncbi:hypothetical protein RJ641_022097 [Dillenia turbinata]|uniref:Protein POLAR LOCALIZATION DURING ASYMMETRIC DIVISION AND REDISTRIBUTION-like n=1 Tax=Dillenia turbinata TaxID=194707 RepID=A0AAN8YTK3_9MAGN